MKIIEQVVPTGTKFSIGFIGDVQYGNPGFSDGAWSRAERAFRTIKEQTNGAPLYIVGVGDYIDFMSPSNRAAYKASGIYSSSTRSIAERTARPLVDEFLAMAKRLDGTWVAVLQGHHWADIVLDVGEDFDGDNGPPIGHSDQFIAEQLGAKFATSSALINFRIDSKTFRLLAHHGGGGGQTLTYMLNKLIRKSGGWEGVDAFAAGHTHVLSGTGVPKLRWEDGIDDLVARNVPIINTGSFLKGIKKNDLLYPEEKDYSGEGRAMGVPVLTVTPAIGKTEHGIQLSLFW